MSLIDFILNIAALLLWLNWRAVRLDPLRGATPATLAGTIRRIEQPRLKRWHFLAGLFGLLFVRALFYTQIGPAVNWTPKLDLYLVAPAFRGNAFLPTLLFSFLSFLRVLLVFYFWLLIIALINRRVIEPDPLQKMLLFQLGRAARWPWALQAIAPLLAVAILWTVLHPLLTYAGVTTRVASNVRLVEQGLVLGACLYLTLKLVLPGFLFVHLITSYVYLGNSPLWDFVSTTSRNLLAPLNRLPLRLGKVDFAPLVGIVLVLLLLHALPTFIIAQLHQKNLTLWPH